MSKKRMISPKITSTDAFLDMPPTSQNLYFHLNMEADDEGFVGAPKKVMRMIGSSDDDFKILIAKRFVLTFENGVCVIKHWLIHNVIRQDRVIETTYVDEKNRLKVKQNNAYSLNDGHLPDKPSPSIGKVSIDKISIDKGVTVAEVCNLPDFIDSELWAKWEKHRKEIRKKLTPTQKEAQVDFLSGFPDQANEILKYSLSNGYQGLFEPKGAKPSYQNKAKQLHVI